MLPFQPNRQLRILFFIFGPSPSEDEILAADALPGRVMFRNALHVPETGCLEDCDAVTALDQSKVPERYAAAFATPEQAVAARKQKLEQLRAGFDDEVAPNVPPAKPDSDDDQSESKSESESESAAVIADEKPPAAVAARKSRGWSRNV